MGFILRHRLLLLTGLVGLSIVLGINIKNLTRDAGVSTLVAANHPDYLYWKETEEIFGATDQIVVGITAEESIYTLDTVQFIHELTLFFEEQEEVDEDDVISLTNVEDIEGLEGELLVEPFIEVEEIDELDSETLAAIREKVRSNPLFYGKLIINPFAEWPVNGVQPIIIVF